MSTAAARFENFSEEVTGILNQLGVSFQNVEHFYRTDRKHYLTYYDDDSIEAVYDIYRSDIDLFGYRFGM